MADEDRGDSYARSVFSPQVPVRQGLGEMAQAALRMPGAMLRDWWKWRTAQLTPEATQESILSGGGPMSAGGLGPIAGWVKGYGFHRRTGVPDRIEAGPGRYGTSPASLRANIEGTPGGYAHVGWLGGTGESQLPGREAGYTAGGELARGPGLMETMKLRDEAIPYLQELGIKGVTFTPLRSGTDVATGTQIGPAGRVRLNEVLIGNKATETPYGGHVIPFREPEFYRTPAWYEGPPPKEVAKAKAYMAGTAPPEPPVTGPGREYYSEGARRGAAEEAEREAARLRYRAADNATDRAHFDRAMQEMQTESTRLGRALTAQEIDAALRRTARTPEAMVETTRRQDLPLTPGQQLEAERLAMLAQRAQGLGGRAEELADRAARFSRIFPDATVAELEAMAQEQQHMVDDLRQRGGR
jgi:hypothetical protein